MVKAKCCYLALVDQPVSPIPQPFSPGGRRGRNTPNLIPNPKEEAVGDNMNSVSDPIRALLDRIVDNFRRLLAENLAGIYLHGSLAMGGFNPQTSDIDFIVVTNDRLDAEVKKAIIQFTLELAREAPPKGLEFSVVVLDATHHFVYPTPYELHYSQGWHDVYQSGQVDYAAQRNDPDLAAHFMIIRRRGICLYGKPIEEVFAEVPEAYYWASIMADAQDILSNMACNPVYSILNLCRVFAFKQARLITSKVEGGHWGLKNLDPHYHGLIQQALNEYEGGKLVIPDWDHSQLESFAAYMKALL